ncbi:adenine nucleotide alpha hydrolase family protein, partial [Candidatus Woesearchaeota archaeon]|nr:adenine nucleotide alpha hydrolase family protein [Candidatus Woesearchaeota archaeon]
MKCRFCNKKAIYEKERLCEEHFIKYYEKKIQRVVDSARLKDKKILIAISGGKDSVAAAVALHSLGINFDLFFINLGIPGISEESRRVVEQLAEILEKRLIIYNLEEKEGFSIRDVHRNIGKIKWFKNTCSICGVIKRYIMNKYAYENNYDYIITGHNMDDELAISFLNLYSQQLEQLKRTGKIIPSIKEKRLVGRVKLLYHLTEEENLLYVKIKNMPYTKMKCPY